ncbi:MAG: alpha/beta fold hydrolase [Verrucomicrobiota bacterium]
MKIPVSPDRIALTLAAGLLVSCGTALPPQPEKAQSELHGSGLATAEHLLKRGKRFTTDEDASCVYQLRAAELAWAELDTDGGSVTDVKSLGEAQQKALHIISSATEGVAVNFIGAKYKPEKRFSYAGFSYRVNAGLDQKQGIYPLASIESAKPAHEVKHRLCTNWHTEEGAGLPVAPKWKRPTDAKMQRFVTTRGYLEPITAVLTFGAPAKNGGGRDVSITGYDPTYLSRVKLGETEYPLAADFTAPIVEQTYDINEITIALSGLLHPGVLDSKLILLEPYDADRIPILLVHGLNSHPRMWKDIINDLRADPKLRGRYQFMLFYYPTGWPIAYSSMRLRQELAALEELVGTPKKMVLVGHSMGGLLSRMQVINPGRKIWDAQLGANADKLHAQLPAHHLVKRSLLFSADPDIGREVYICTPHRGSGLADLSITGWFIKLLKLPSTITSAFIDLPSNIVDRGKLTSVAGLSPTNPLYKALDEVPIQVPHHSIIGDRGKGDTPNSSDGVVPYWSSHLKSAQSELIVPANHGAYKDPQAIRELRRILLLNAGIKD